MFASIQNAFAKALLNPDRPIPDTVASWSSARPQKRFAVYRNNVAASLIEAMRTRFPASERIVGAEFFAAMAHRFVTLHPPKSPVMMWYGDDFPDFIERFEPAREVPYLADVARLEAARTHAYHARDAEPVPPSAFEALGPELLAQSRIGLHPSARLVESRHPIVTIWAMNAGERELAPVEEMRGETALVIRPKLTVLVHHAPPGFAVVLRALAAGEALGAAADAAAGCTPDFDLSAALTLLIGSGVVADLDSPST